MDYVGADGIFNDAGQPAFTSAAAIAINLDGGGAAIPTGVALDIEVPFAGAIQGYTIMADVAATCSIELWSDLYAAYPPTSADKITASAPISLSAAVKNKDDTLTGWGTILAKGDIIRVNVVSNDNAKRITISLRIQRASE